MFWSELWWCLSGCSECLPERVALARLYRSVRELHSWSRVRRALFYEDCDDLLPGAGMAHGKESLLGLWLHSPQTGNLSATRHVETSPPETDDDICERSLSERRRRVKDLCDLEAFEMSVKQCTRMSAGVESSHYMNSWVVNLKQSETHVVGNWS